LLSHSEIIQKLNDYVTSHSLNPAGKDQRNLKLDLDLGRACGVFKSKSAADNATEVVTMPRIHVIQGLKDGMQACVRIGGQGGVIKKGTLHPVQIATKTRQGRKMVTLITGMETFGVDPDEMAEELKKICAGSATGELLCLMRCCCGFGVLIPSTRVVSQ
jgi:translation initiation factor 2D